MRTCAVQSIVGLVSTSDMCPLLGILALLDRVMLHCMHVACQEGNEVHAM